MVDGDRASDVTVMQDRSNLRPVVGRGELVDLEQPRPERRKIADENIAHWAAETLTYKRAVGSSSDVGA